MRKYAWGEATKIIVLAILLALTYNFVSPHGIPLLYKPQQLTWAPDSSFTKGIPVSEPLAIDIDQAEQLFREGKAVFIDARHEEDFALGHIKGALSLPLDLLEKHSERIATIPKDALIVTYCGGEECALSTDLGFKLASMGYQNVRIFFSGWIEWKRQNLPVETGLPPVKNQ